MSPKRRLFWREAYVQFKIYKAHRFVRAMFGGSVEKLFARVARSTGSDHFRKFGCRNSAAVAAGNTFPSQNARKHGFMGDFWRDRSRKMLRPRKPYFSIKMLKKKVGKTLFGTWGAIDPNTFHFVFDAKDIASDKYGRTTCLQSHVPKFGDTDTTLNVPIQNLPNPDMHQHEQYVTNFCELPWVFHETGVRNMWDNFFPSCSPLCITKKVTSDIVVAARTRPKSRTWDIWNIGKNHGLVGFLPSSTGDICGLRSFPWRATWFFSTDSSCLEDKLTHLSLSSREELWFELLCRRKIQSHCKKQY